MNKYKDLLLNFAKVCTLMIIYYCIKLVDAVSKEDQIRKKWTLEVIIFLNFVFLAAISFKAMFEFSGIRPAI